MKIRELHARQKDFFASGKTLEPAFRLTQIRKFRNLVKQKEQAIAAALRQDLGKSETESYMTETGMLLSEADYLCRHLKKWAHPRRVRTPLSQFPAKSYVFPCPFGNTLIISPWNYPFLLTTGPLLDALAAGNTAIVKTSPFAPAAGALVADMINRCFPPEYVTVVQGEQLEDDGLLEEKFDYIFFTGSTAVGRIIAEKAAKQLIPVTLELGGKSPCIVHESADLQLAARRIVFGKFLNCGQTCVAPDYLLVQRSIQEKLLELIRREIRRQYGDNPLENPNYGKIVTPRHFQRLRNLYKNEEIFFGGKHDGEQRIEPTILQHVQKDAPIMQEEIFGPLLPVFIFNRLAEIKDFIAQHPTPLALYLFTQDKTVRKEILTGVSFGGGCVNDTVVHLATPYMGFGGVGNSGMGSYHGKAGFDTFTHYKSIIAQKGSLDLPLRYGPYSKKKLRLIQKFLK